VKHDSGSPSATIVHKWAAESKRPVNGYNFYHFNTSSSKMTLERPWCYGHRRNDLIKLRGFAHWRAGFCPRSRRYTSASTKARVSFPKSSAISFKQRLMWRDTRELANLLSCNSLAFLSILVSRCSTLSACWGLQTGGQWFEPTTAHQFIRRSEAVDKTLGFEARSRSSAG
jgi:hypothetical protein